MFNMFIFVTLLPSENNSLSYPITVFAKINDILETDRSMYSFNI